MESTKTLATVIGFAAILAASGLVFVARSDGAPRAIAETPRTNPEPAPVPAPVAVQDNEKGDEPNPRLVIPSLDEPDVALDGKASDRADFVAPIQGGGFIFERR